MRSILAVVVLATTLLGVAEPAVASDPPGGFDFNPSDDGGAVDTVGSQPGTTPSGQPGPSKPVLTIPEPYSTYKYAPNCSGSSVTSAGELEGDENCVGATTGCPDNGYRYKVYALKHSADGTPDDEGYQPAGVECRNPNDLDEGGPAQITVADIAEQAREAAPETVVNVEPVDRSYVNLPTNFYSDDDVVDATVTVLGQDIGLSFEPSGFAWSYGDGSGGSGAGVAGAKAGSPRAVEHAYRRSDDVSVTLTRTFDVTFTLPGGQTGTLPAPGVSNTSAPYPLQIREIQATVTDIG